VSGAERLRIRYHVEWPETPPADALRSALSRDALFEARRALLLLVITDELERMRFAMARELLDGATCRECVALPPGARDEDWETAIEWTRSHRPDVPAGVLGDIERLSLVQLGQLVCLRCYRANVALVAWNLLWTVGQLSAHVGPSRRGDASIALYGTGIWKDGEWRDSWRYPRLIVSPRASSQSGAFLSWGKARDEGCRPKVARHRFVDLAVLSGAALGGDVRDAAQALALLELR
jgi:hypothetical protein